MYRGNRFGVRQMAHELNNLTLFIAREALDFINYFCGVHGV